MRNPPRDEDELYDEISDDWNADDTDWWADPEDGWFGDWDEFEELEIEWEWEQ